MIVQFVHVDANGALQWERPIRIHVQKIGHQAHRILTRPTSQPPSEANALDSVCAHVVYNECEANTSQSIDCYMLVGHVKTTLKARHVAKMIDVALDCVFRHSMLRTLRPTVVCALYDFQSTTRTRSL